jgi:ABC-2 type transport system permease protein
LGKGFAHTLLYLAHGVVYFLILPMMYGYSLKFNIGLLFVFLVLFFMSVSFMAQSLSYFFKKREHSFLVIVVSAMPILFAAGFIWAREAIPNWVNLIALIFPSTTAANAIVRINQMGAGFSNLTFDLLVLAVLCGVYFVIACKVGNRAS